MQVRKKHHFKLKKFFKFKKHLLKFNSFGFKVISSIKVLKKQEEYLKLYIIKSLKNISKNKFKV